MSRLQKFFCSPRTRVGAILLAVVLVMPSLRGGLVGDDVRHALILRGDSEIELLQEFGPLDLFVFATGEPEYTARMQEIGIYPWWASPDTRLAFYRPLASATHWIDQTFWPSTPELMHAQNVFWFVVVILVIGAVYRRLFAAPWLAGLALVLFALDDAHASLVAWLAARYGLIVAALSFLAFIAHDRWRRDGWSPGAWLGPAIFTVALFAGEAAVAICAYLFAHALFLDHGTLWRRLLRLAPYGLITVAWRIIYQINGFGAGASEVYRDPGREGLGFLATMAERLPSLLLSQFWVPASDLWIFYPRGVLLTVSFAAVAVIAVGLALGWPLFVRDKLARFWLTGSAIAAIPICAVIPSDRHLLFVGVGGMGLIAQLLGLWLARPEWLPRSTRRFKLIRAVGVGLVVIHLILAPLILPVRSSFYGIAERRFQEAVEDLPRTPDFGDKTLVVVTAPSEAHTAYIHPSFDYQRRQRPKNIRSLITGVSELKISRPDSHTLVLEPTAGFFPSIRERTLRNPTQESRVGETIELPPMRVEISALTADGRPSKATFRFDVPLDDPSLLWFTWKGTRFAPFELPPVGGQVVVPRQRLMDLLTSK